jgi:wyosine [tRNA(Phe)-imidazoG37] synthetase (radical SAM superfamily)
LGRSLKISTAREDYYRPEDLFRETVDKIAVLRKQNEKIDYLTFVPDGEPTLDKNLGKTIELLKPLGYKIAVITNSTLLHRKDVRSDLYKADWVSVKIDTSDEDIWRRIDRPSKKINFQMMMEGISLFAEEFGGILVTETMLVKDINDGIKSLQKTAQYIKTLNPEKSYLSIPTRPPAEEWAVPPSEEKINLAFNIFSDHISGVEYLIGYEGNEFSFTGNTEKDILSITAVHPMRRDALELFLQKTGEDFGLVEKLISNGELLETQYRGNLFYLRKLRPRGG